MEKIFALHGRINGTARVHAGDGRTALSLSADKSLPAACTAYLLCGGQLWALPINGAAGSVKRELSPEALLVAAGEVILCTGGFAGRACELKKYETEVRILALASEQKAEPSESANEEGAGKKSERASASNEAVKAEAAAYETEPKAQPTKAAASKSDEAKKGSSAQGKNEAAHEPNGGAGGPSARQNVQATPCGAGPFPQVLADILARAQTLFGPLRETAPPPETPSAPKPAEPPYCPFPDFYPEAQWKKVPYPGARRCYLEGRAESERLLLHGIPGEYAPVPPVPGFKRFLRDRDGCGYWIRIRKI